MDDFARASDVDLSKMESMGWQDFRLKHPSSNRYAQYLVVFREGGEENPDSVCLRVKLAAWVPFDGYKHGEFKECVWQGANSRIDQNIDYNVLYWKSLELLPIKGDK